MGNEIFGNGQGISNPTYVTLAAYSKSYEHSLSNIRYHKVRKEICAPAKLIRSK